MAARGGDGVVEAAGVGLGCFGGLARGFEDGEVLGVDGGEVCGVDLGGLLVRVQGRKGGGGERTGNLALTSAKALPATPSETWNSEYSWTERTPRLTLRSPVAAGSATDEARREKRTAALKYMVAVVEKSVL